MLIIYDKEVTIMFMVIIIILAGISLYALLKPPTDLEYEQALIIEPITTPQLEITEQRCKPTVRKLDKVYN